MAKIEDSPSLTGDPPSPPSTIPDSETDANGDDGYPSFWPEVLRFNRGDVLTVGVALGISYVIRWCPRIQREMCDFVF